MVKSIIGMESLNDQVIAIDYLVSVKSMIQSYTIALTEVASPELRKIFRNQLKDSIEVFENISNYMEKT